MNIQFFGAAGEVTGSCFLLDTGKNKILIDIGMFQGSEASERRNAKLPPFDPAAIDAVLLTHAHLDHCGRLPLLVARGYEGKVFATPGTSGLARVVLEDAAHLQVEDAQRLTRKRARQGKPAVQPLFGPAEVRASLDKIFPVPYGQSFTPVAGVDVEFMDAGHILGSSLIRLRIRDRGIERTLVFSGDLGHVPQPMLNRPAHVEVADTVVMESTYGDRDHRSWHETFAELRDVLATARSQRGKVLIPAFAVGRTQSLLYLLRDLHKDGALHDIPVYLDSPMAIAATAVYARHPEMLDASTHSLAKNGDAPLHFPGLKFVRTVEESRALNDYSGPAIIIAGSGMCNGGRILQHFKHQIWRENTHVIFTGFQASGTLGRQIVDGARRITLMGERIVVRAQIHTLGGLSAHAGRSELLDWVEAVRGGERQFILVHGEEGPRAALAAAMLDRFGIKAYLPRPREVIEC
jgi:metallo-beta-lactamase family protein